MKIILKMLIAASAATSSWSFAAPEPKKDPVWVPSLIAEEAPSKKPWEDGATLSVSSTSGQSTVLADAVLKFERFKDTETNNGFSRNTWGPGLYVHRNTDTASPTNDRGIKLSYGGLFVNNSPAHGARVSWGWNVDAKAGKKLTSDSSTGTKLWFDKDSSRLTLAGQYMHLASIGILDPQNIEPQCYRFFTATGRLYLDRIAGGSGVSGSVSGAEANLRADVAPWGINPRSVSGTGLAVVTAFGVWAQYQHDLSATDGREKDDRELYGAKLQFLFSQLDSEGIVPGIALERTIGSDLLAGRSQSGITKLTLTLKY